MIDCMPIKLSAVKALRQSHKRENRNRAHKRRIIELTKTSLRAIEKKETAAVKAVQTACTAIDKTVQKGILHKNTGARKKSRLMKFLNRSTK